jgi:hypothetical protein
MEKEYSQNEFIKIIESGKTDSTFKVDDLIHLNHDLCNTFKVIDVNHDNTTNTVDIMPTTQVATVRFGNAIYKDSSIREWINGPYIKLFDSDVQDIMADISVDSNNEIWFDKAKILSATEIGLIDEDALDNEGKKYPIFESGGWIAKIESRWISKGNYGSTYRYFLRSIKFNLGGAVSDYVWSVDNSCICDICNYDSTYGVVPVLRF